MKVKLSDFLSLLYTDCAMVCLLKYDDGNDEGDELFSGEAADAMKGGYASRIVESFVPGTHALYIYLE